MHLEHRRQRSPKQASTDSKMPNFTRRKIYFATLISFWAFKTSTMLMYKRANLTNLALKRDKTVMSSPW